MPDNKGSEESAPLRRSTRSTRGSIKPVVVDLVEPDLSDEEASKPKKRVDKDVICPVEQVDDDDDGEEDDEEYKEPVAKPKRASTSTRGRRQSKVATSKTESVTQEEKTTKKGAKKQEQAETKPTQAATTKTPAKSSSKAAGKAKSQEQTNDNNDDVHIYYELSEKEMKEVNNAFDMNCSTDGEELLCSGDLKTAIRSLGFEPRADEIQNLLKKFSNKTGKINRDGFHKIMAFKMGSSPGLTGDKDSNNDEISRVFNLLDLDKTGMITLDNLKSISKELNEEITDEELHEMIAEADIDGDFQINKQEFYNIMKKTSLY